jgi:hypothetical protein
MAWIKPMRLTRYLITQFNNGAHRRRLEDTAKDIFGVKSITNEHTEEIMRVWRRAEEHCRSRGLCVIPVAKFYFEKFTEKKEPTKADHIKLCIAGGWSGATDGFRMLSMKGSKNDPMAVMYLQIRIRCVRGGESAILDRITVEWTRGALTKALAKQMVDAASEPALPAHEAEFGKLME